MFIYVVTRRGYFSQQNLCWCLDSLEAARELLGLSFENLQHSNDSIMLAIPNVMKTDYFFLHENVKNTCKDNKY